MEPRRWREFPRAREFVRSLKLLDRFEWSAYVRGELRKLRGSKPADIPAAPRLAYRGQGWRGMRDWLGPRPVAPVKPGYLEFRRARGFARSLELASSTQWRRWCAGLLADRPPRPANIPEDPPAMYPDAWRGWAEWLGTHRAALRRDYLPFGEAREFVWGLVLDDVKEWHAFCRGELRDLGRKPEKIPATPGNVYRHSGWKGYGDWLGTGNQSAVLTPHLPFEDARNFARSLGLSSEDEWKQWARGGRPDLPLRPWTIPWNPHRIYAKTGWTGWGDFLGTGNVSGADRVFRPFAEAREFARSLGLRSAKEWVAFRGGGRPDLGRRPQDIPAAPNMTYAGRGWVDWGDFLGTGNVSQNKRIFRSYAKARRFARKLGLATGLAWREYMHGCRPDLPPPPSDIPIDPESTYADQGWAAWHDFLGCARHNYRPMSYEQARDFSRRLGLRRAGEWMRWVRGKRPDLPSPPDEMPRWPRGKYRKKGWTGWGDFLNTDFVPPQLRTYRSFEEIRAFARTLGLRSSSEWQAWSRGGRPDLPLRPQDVPARPDRKYAAKGFTSWADFLGAESDGRGRKLPQPGREPSGLPIA